jgi:hypothetical protein
MVTGAPNAPRVRGSAATFALAWAGRRARRSGAKRVPNHEASDFTPLPVGPTPPVFAISGHGEELP